MLHQENSGEIIQKEWRDGAKAKTTPSLDVTGNRSKVRCCKEQYCIGTCNARSISSVESLNRVRLSATPWISAHQASLSITNSQSSLRLTPIESVMSSSQWCHSAISFSIVPFSSCPQSLPASESFPMSQLFAWGQKKMISHIYKIIKERKHESKGLYPTDLSIQLGKGSIKQTNVINMQKLRESCLDFWSLWRSGFCDWDESNRWRPAKFHLFSWVVAGWHHQLDGREFGWTPGDGDGQRGLECCHS